VGEGRAGEPQANQERLTVAQAAATLGITEGAVRSRIKRGTLPTAKEGGTVFVLLDGGTSQANRPPNIDVPKDRSELIASLQDQVRYLREQLGAEREARTEERRRQDTVIAQLSAANAEHARTLRSIEGLHDRSQEDQEPTQGHDATTEASPLPIDQWTLLPVALIGPVAAALLFEASLWGSPSVQVWFYVAVVFAALLPIVCGVAVGLMDPSFTLTGGAMLAMYTLLVGGIGIAVTHSLYETSLYSGPLLTPTTLVVPLVSGVLAALLWVFFALLALGLKRQRAQGRAGAQGRTLNWQIILALVGSLVSA
jgi:cation transport ATPase